MDGLRRHVDRQLITDFLTHFIQERSPAPKVGPVDVAKAQHWLAAQLASFGVFDEIDVWEVEPGQPNVVAVCRGAGNGPSLMFHGHTDVVPVTDAQAALWTGDPWSGEVRDGAIWGRGASDMKGGLAAAICAVRFLRELGVRPVGDVLVAANIGEEYVRPEIGVLSVLDRGYRADLIVDCEPTELAICPVAAGWFMFRLEVYGRAIHPAARHKTLHPSSDPTAPPGVDAIELMTRYMRAFEDLNRVWGLYHHHPLTPPGTSNIGPIEIHGGSAAAAVPELCEATFVVVVSPGRSSLELVEDVRKAISRVTQADPWLVAHPPRLELPVLDPIIYEPMDVPISDRRVQAVCRAATKALGVDPTIGCQTAPSDANILAARGETVLSCGPGGQSFNVHGTDEFVPIANLVDATAIYMAVIEEWCGTTEPLEARS